MSHEHDEDQEVVEDDDQPIPDDDEDDGEDSPDEEPTPSATEEAGETRVAPTTEGDTPNVLAPATTIVVTVRRDFPRRRGERLGEWAWSSAGSSTRQAPQRWQLPSGAEPTPELELEADDDRPIFGWGIGRPSLGSPGDNAGQLTTDRGDPIAAQVRLLDEEGTVVSTADCAGRHGQARLPTHHRSGRHTIEVVPEHLAPGPAGPTMQSSERLLYRAFSVVVGLQGGLLSEIVDPYDPPCGEVRARVGNRLLFEPTAGQLPLSLKPDWWKDDRTSRRRRTVDVLVLHCTGGTRVGPALNRFFRSTAGSNYIVDVDGHAIKLAADDRTKIHAGGHWGGRQGMIQRSFGVEILNPNTGEANAYMARAKTPYTEEQYTTLLRLCRDIVAAYPSIGHRIVGHCDVATGNAQGGSGVPNDTYGNKRNWDPGMHFEWERFAAEGLGMVPGSTFDAATSYAGVFGTIAGLELRQGDHDPRGSSPAVYGGEPRPELGSEVGVIEQLQADVHAVGYQLRVNGRFDDRTFAAVDRFRRHFLRDGMTGRMHGTIDLAAATMIKNVVDVIRPPAPPAEAEPAAEAAEPPPPP